MIPVHQLMHICSKQIHQDVFNFKRVVLSIVLLVLSEEKKYEKYTDQAKFTSKNSPKQLKKYVGEFWCYNHSTFHKRC